MVSPDAYAVIADELRAVPYPEITPVYRSLLLDPAGNLWLENYHPNDTPARWNIVDGTGAWIATLITPSNLRLTDVESDQIIGVVMDSLGVERVQANLIRKH
jgi:hypothetical protein